MLGTEVIVAAIATLGTIVTGVMSFALGRRKEKTEWEKTAVNGYDRLCTDLLARIEKLTIRLDADEKKMAAQAEQIEAQAQEIARLRAALEESEAQQRQLRIELDAAKAENVKLRQRITEMEERERLATPKRPKK